MGVLVLSHDDVIVALPPAECAETMAQVLAAHARGEAHMPLRSVMAAPRAAGFMRLDARLAGRPGSGIRAQSDLRDARQPGARA